MTLLSLVIPCYNEAGNIPALLQRCQEAFANYPIEVILVDNGSNDETQILLQSLLPRYPVARSVRVTRNQGYGYGILMGLREARGQYIGWTHADLQADPADAIEALKIIQAHPNEQLFVKGKRHGRRFSDLLFTLGMSLFDSILLRTCLWDINAQPNIMPKAFFNTWKNPPHDFALDLYAYYLAKRAGLTVKRFPVFFGKRIAGTAHLNSLRARIKYSMRTIKYSFALKKILLIGMQNEK